MRVGVRVRVVRGWSGLEQLLGLRIDGDAAHALVEVRGLGVGVGFRVRVQG